MDASTRASTLSLSHPPLEDNHPLVRTAAVVAQECIASQKSTCCNGMSVDELQRAVLVFCVNGFAEGSLYERGCRLNHGCSPNVLSVVEGEYRIFRALRAIEEGDELLISYLADFALMSVAMRRRFLWETRGFVCDCPMCISSEDPFRDIPCGSCHPCDAQTSLSADVAMEEVPVSYARFCGGNWICQSCGHRFAPAEAGWERNIESHVFNFYTAFLANHT